MPFREARQVLEYWNERPPEHEMMIMFAQRFMDWRPAGKQLTEKEVIAAHRRSLEERWQAGAMNIEQMWRATGGAIAAGGGPGLKLPGNQMPGIGPFPGVN